MSLRKPFEMTKEGCPSIDFDIDFIPDGFELCELPGFTVPEIKRTSIPIIPPIAMPSLEDCVCIAPIYQSADSEITQNVGNPSLNIEIRHPPSIPEEDIDCCDEPLEIHYEMNIPPSGVSKITAGRFIYINPVDGTGEVEVNACLKTGPIETNDSESEITEDTEEAASLDIRIVQTGKYHRDPDTDECVASPVDCGEGNVYNPVTGLCEASDGCNECPEVVYSANFPYSVLPDGKAPRKYLVCDISSNPIWDYMRWR